MSAAGAGERPATAGSALAGARAIVAYAFADRKTEPSSESAVTRTTAPASSSAGRIVRSGVHGPLARVIASAPA